MGHITTPPVTTFILVLYKILLSSADQAWSPIVGGRALFPPLVSTPSLLVHSGPLYSHHSDHREEHYNNRRVSSYRDPYYRRNYRRRKRYWRHRPSPRYRRVRSHSYFSAQPSSHYTDWWSWPDTETRARSRDFEETESAETGRSLVKSVRSLFGAPEHCLEDGRQFSCTLAPVCWMTGGVATSGIQIVLFYIVFGNVNVLFLVTHS